MSKVLVISDLHAPFIHKYALTHVKRIRDKYKCDTVVSIGDVFDCYSWSRFPSDPEEITARTEFKRAKRQISSWTKEFPDVALTIGNHDGRIFKRLKESRIPQEMVARNFNEIWDLPKTWKWVKNIVIDGVYYFHGFKGGEYAHISTAKDMRRSIVVGHAHTGGGVHYMSNTDTTIFAMNAGCLCDENEIGFAYAGEFTKRCVLGCGVVIDGHAIFEPMK